MKVFVAGSTGAIGKSLVPHLVENGHEVIALVRTAQKGQEVEALGAKAAVADALDKNELTAAIKKAGPEVILHQLTALTGAAWNFKKFEEEFALTNRFRTEVTDTMLGAARLVGERRCAPPLNRSVSETYFSATTPRVVDENRQSWFLIAQSSNTEAGV